MITSMLSLTQRWWQQRWQSVVCGDIIHVAPGGRRDEIFQDPIYPLY